VLFDETLVADLLDDLFFVLAGVHRGEAADEHEGLQSNDDQPHRLVRPALEEGEADRSGDDRHDERQSERHVHQRGVQRNTLHRDLPPGRSVLSIENAPDLPHRYAERAGGYPTLAVQPILIVSRP
jgi:hypothetical protein